jgi:hypothetical protein
MATELSPHPSPHLALPQNSWTSGEAFGPNKLTIHLRERERQRRSVNLILQEANQRHTKRNPKWHFKTCKCYKTTGCKRALNFSFTKDSKKFFSYNLDSSNTEAKLRNPEKRRELELLIRQFVKERRRKNRNC